MMMKLACKDLDPMTACNFEARGFSAKEVANKMMEHMKTDHPDKMKEMNMSEDETMSMLKAKAVQEPE